MDSSSLCFFLFSVFAALSINQKVLAIRYSVHDHLGKAMHPTPFKPSSQTIKCHAQFQTLCPNPDTVFASWKCLRSAIDTHKFTHDCNALVELSSPCLNDAIALCSASIDAVPAVDCLLKHRLSTSKSCQNYLQRSPAIVCEASTLRICPEAKTMKESGECIRTHFSNTDKACQKSVHQWRNIHMRLPNVKETQRDANLNRTVRKRALPMPCLAKCTALSATNPAQCIRNHFDEMPQACILDLSASVLGQCVLFLQRRCRASIDAREGVLQCMRTNWSFVPPQCREDLQLGRIALSDGGIVKYASASPVQGRLRMNSPTVSQRILIFVRASASMGGSSLHKHSDDDLKFALTVIVCCIGSLILIGVLIALIYRKKKSEASNTSTETSTSEASYALIHDASSL